MTLAAISRTRRVVGCCLDDHRRRAVVPGVEETTGCPDPRPVACLSACLAAEHSLGGRPAQGEQERVVYVVAALEGQPVALCDSYYPADWASGTATARPERIRGGGYALIEDPEGPIRRQIARSVDDLVARMPTHEEAVELGLPPGVPVVRVLRTVFDSDDLPVEVQDSVVAADRHEFRYEEQMRE
jgi:GntR family transcriptional regulator